MIFRHGCGGDCGCECVPCNQCNEDDEDLLPETITVSFTFDEGTYGLCASLWNGREIVLTKSVSDFGGCPSCVYSAYACGSAALGIVSVDFLGIGLGIGVAFSQGPCDLRVNYVGEAVDCFLTPITMENGPGITTTISPGGTPSTDPPFLTPVRPTAATVTLAYGSGTKTETSDPLPNSLTPPGGFGLASYSAGPAPGEQGLVGLFALADFVPPFSLGFVMRNVCPFWWSLTFTAYGEPFFESDDGGPVLRDIGFYGEAYSVSRPVLADFSGPNATIPWAITLHTVRLGVNTWDMTVPYDDWTPAQKSDWAFYQAKGWLPSVATALDAPQPTIDVNATIAGGVPW